jgi:hypothetical protein
MLHREWSATDLAIVRQRLEQHATYKIIAGEFHCSPAAIGGIVSRNGMVGISRHKAIAKPKPTTATAQRTNRFLLSRAVNPFTVPSRGTLRDLPVENSPQAKCWEDFHASVHCHWPLGGEPFQFCGRKRLAKPRIGKQSPYCAAHEKRSKAIRP